MKPINNNQITLGSVDPENDLEWMLQSEQVADDTLIRALVHEYYPGIYRLALFLLGESTAASEAEQTAARQVSQQALLAVVMDRHRYWGEPDLSAWVLGIAVRTIRKAVPGLDASWSGAGRLIDQPSKTSPGVDAEMQTLLASLDKRQHLLLLLRYAHGLNVRSIAHVLKTNQRAISEKLKNLRESLQQELAGPDSRLEKTSSGANHLYIHRQLHAEIDGTPNPEDREAVRQHLKECPDCQAYASELDRFETRLESFMQVYWPEPDLVQGEESLIIQATCSMFESRGKRRKITLHAKESSIIALIILTVIGIGWAIRITAPNVDPPSRSARQVQSASASLKPEAMTPETINAGGLPTAEPGNERPWFNSNAVTPPVTFIYLDDFIKNTPAISETAGIFQSGPASLEVVLHYWGWKEDNRDTLQATIEAANLMTYGIVKYVYSQTNLRALSRVGGDIGTLKHLLAAGFPVIVERGLQSGSDNETGGWIGNFVVINGYDDSQQRFTILSSSHKTGTYSDIYYGSFEQQWRAFNNLYLVVYQPDQEQMINDILGSQVDTRENYLRAAENASRDAYNSIYVRDQFFAWFNRGTNLTYLLNYREAAAAFDQAFSIYKKIPENELPWRLLWYQTSFYQAYFGSARYQDVIYLATMALNGPAFDQVEEGYYWRALAEVMLGQKTSALKDLEASVRANPKFSPSVARLEQLKGGGG